MKFKTVIRNTAIVGTLVLAGGLLAGCSATSNDMCAYTQGDETVDAKIHDIYYPGVSISPQSNKKVYYFPCNARNLRFVDGSTDVRADGEPIGRIVTRTSTGTQVSVELTAYWTLNQDREVLKNTTIPLMMKYQAASDDSNVRNANFATNGWSKGLLGENMTPIMESVTRDVIKTSDDTVFTDPAQKRIVAEKVSKQFMENVKVATGSTSDVFCGSGESSGWEDPNNPGNGKYTCGSVRIDVTEIVETDTSRLDARAREARAEAEGRANKAQLDAAKAKYGDKAEEVLGDLDRIKACKDAGLQICSTGGVTVGVNN